MSRQQSTISKGIDWALVWIYIILVFIGLTSIFATEFHAGDNLMKGLLSSSTYYGKQFVFIGICTVLAIFILLTDSKLFTATANISYMFGILLLLLTFVIGKGVKGSHSWIQFGFFGFQPAELCKVFTSLALAKYLSRMETDFSKSRSQLIAAGIALLPAVITVAQNETGLALVYFTFFLVMYREGLPVTYIAIGIFIAILMIATLLIPTNILSIALLLLALLVVYLLRRQLKRQRGLLLLIIFITLGSMAFQRYAVPFVVSKVMKGYQRTRILSTLGVDQLPWEKGKEQEAVTEEQETAKKGKKKADDYNVKQSKIAIGSGGWIGKGFLKGTQTRYDFVPEQRTDFIFCTIGEGFGFLGSLLFLSIYIILLMRIVTIAERQRSAFSRVYAYCVASIVFFHLVINVGMTIGLAPVIGIPLPFISYGGSSLITFTILIFILIRLDADRQMILR
jgi:rod shape determining protein RodA